VKKKKVEYDADMDNPPFGLKWIRDESLLILDSEELAHSDKLACFDLDDTLIKTKTGRKFPQNRGDWTWWDSSVPDKLKSLKESGYKIVIFTNQLGLKKDPEKKLNLVANYLI